jgi:hypothetical protein
MATRRSQRGATAPVEKAQRNPGPSSPINKSLPGHEEQAGYEDEGGQESDLSTVPSNPATPTNMSLPEGARTAFQETQQAMARRIRELEEALRLQERLTQLEREFEARNDTLPKGSRKRRYSHSSESDKDRGGEIKIKNISTLAQPTNARKRLDWIYDLEDAFKAAPRRFRKGATKILYAIHHMHNDCRARWRRHLEEQSSEDREEYSSDWEYFREWTLVLIKDAANRETLLATQIETAC